MSDTMLEKQVWQRFKKVWPYRAIRIEPGIGSGIPDVLLWDKHGNLGLIELKRPNRVKLSASQWTWHRLNQKANGDSAVVTCSREKFTLQWSVFSIFTDEEELIPVTKTPMNDERMLLEVSTLLRLSL